LSFRNFSLKYLKPLPRFFIASTKFFIKSNLMCSGNKKILSLSTISSFLTCFSSGTEFSHMGQSLTL
jgi:hypothetical protein